MSASHPSSSASGRAPVAATLLVLAALVVVLVATCGDEPAETGGDATTKASGGGVAKTEPAGPVRYTFRDETAASGFAAFTQVNGDPLKPFIVESIGGGVALFDADGDGDLDAYLTNGSYLEGPKKGEPRDALFLNDGEGHFSDGTEAAGLGHAGWSNGVRATDYDGDGDLDLYVTCYGPNVLYANQGDGTFVDVTARAGVGDPRWSTGACFLDYDRDGDLDLYVANYIEFAEEEMLRDRPRGTINGHRSGGEDEYEDVVVMKGPRGLPPARDRFYVNNGDGTFRDASVEVGIDAKSEAFGFQCLAFDVDQDGWVDVYVANDVVANLLWRNDGGKGFTEEAMLSGLALSMDGNAQGGMGANVGDFDGDLIPDVYVTNYVDDYSTLYRGREAGTFVDTTSRMRLNEVTFAMVGWGCGFADFDSDGDLELFAVNGHVYPQVDGLDLGTTYKQKNQLFEYDGERFVVPAGGGGPGWALQQASRGAAVGDVDGDGDLDVLIGNIDDHPALLVNDSPNGNWVKLRVLGPAPNRDAIGARMTLRIGDRRQLRLVGTSGSFLSSSSELEHVGLGTHPKIDELVVRWPDGKEHRATNLEAGGTYVIDCAGDEAQVTRRD